jgi:hypothetical protein
MLGLFATLVFASAGCFGAAVIGTSLRNALPAVRRLAAERRSLAEDSVYLFTLIETPRHADAVAPAMVTVVDAAAALAPVRAAVGSPVRRRQQGAVSSVPQSVQLCAAA